MVCSPRTRAPPSDTPPDAPSPAAPVASHLAWAIPIAAAVSCAGNEMGFFDSPELAAAGVGLGVTHPPGHPLWVVIAACSALVPLGAAPLRIAITEAVLLGVIGRLTYGVSLQLVSHVGGERLTPARRPWLALVGALCATLGVGVFRQATRVEVYALSGAVCMALLWLAVACDRPLGARVRLGVFVLALGSANHHFIAWTAAPVLLWLAWEHSHGLPAPRRLVAWGSLFALGLVPYVELPLRANAAASLARVHSVRDLVDVASARVFAKNTGLGVPGSAAVRAVEILDWFADTLTPVGVLFALGGVYLAVRARESRRDMARVALLIGVSVLARAWLGFVKDNPDAAGYLLPAMASAGALVPVFAAGAWRAVLDAPAAPKGPTVPARVLLLTLLVGAPVLLPVWLATNAWRASAIDRSSAPNTLALAVFAGLPPRTIVFGHDPQTLFRLRYLTLVEGERPDVTVVPVPLLAYPGMVDGLIAREPVLTPVLTQYLLRPDLGTSPRLLAGIAIARAVVIETDPRNAHDLPTLLLPRGMVYEVRAEPTTLAAVRGAAAAHFTRMDQLTELLHRDPTASAMVDEVLLWHAYNDAMFFAARGAPAEARRAVARGLEIDPSAHELTVLREQLGH